MIQNFVEEVAIRDRNCHKCGEPLHAGETLYVEHTTEMGWPRKKNHCLGCYLQVLLNERQYIRNSLKKVRRLIRRQGK